MAVPLAGCRRDDNTTSSDNPKPNGSVAATAPNTEAPADLDAADDALDQLDAQLEDLDALITQSNNAATQATAPPPSE
jgi:hypothetical protein